MLGLCFFCLFFNLSVATFAVLVKRQCFVNCMGPVYPSSLPKTQPHAPHTFSTHFLLQLHPKCFEEISILVLSEGRIFFMECSVETINNFLFFFFLICLLALCLFMLQLVFELNVNGTT